MCSQLEVHLHAIMTNLNCTHKRDMRVIPQNFNTSLGYKRILIHKTSMQPFGALGRRLRNYLAFLVHVLQVAGCRHVNIPDMTNQHYNNVYIAWINHKASAAISYCNIFSLNFVYGYHKGCSNVVQYFSIGHSLDHSKTSKQRMHWEIQLLCPL